MGGGFGGGGVNLKRVEKKLVEGSSMVRLKRGSLCKNKNKNNKKKRIVLFFFPFFFWGLFFVGWGVAF